MGSVIPKIKKKVSSYINNETGSISKQSLITIGAFMGTAAIATLAATTPARASVTATLRPEQGNPISLIGTHSSHESHSSGACGESCGQGCDEGACGECDPTCEASCQSSDMTCCRVQDMGSCGEPAPSEPAPSEPAPSEPAPCGTACEIDCMSHCLHHQLL